MRAYAFSGSPPSAFAAPACQLRQLLLINLSPSENATVEMGFGGAPGAAFSAWILSPPPNATDMMYNSNNVGDMRALDPFSDRARLNGQLLPNVVDGPAPFLDDIPIAAVAGSGAAHLPPLSIAFLCFHSNRH